MISSKEMTKEWRHSFFKVNNISQGNSMKPEDWQRKCISNICGITPLKSSWRINLKEYSMRNLSHIYKQDDMFDLSETFDGIFEKDNIFYLFNLKMICNQGGSQMRSLREVYHFIDGQLGVLKDHKKIVFVNILDGDFCYKHKSHFSSNNQNLFIGDMKEFEDWWDRRS